MSSDLLDFLVCDQLTFVFDLQSSVESRLRSRMTEVFKQAISLGDDVDMDRQTVLDLVGKARTLVNLGKL
jgi:hypothetical protein